MTLHLETLGAGAPLVLLHGWGFHSAVWDGVAQDLARRRHVHLVDLPGHGRSRDATLGSMDAAVDAIADSIPEGSLVCGWSLGGLLAQRLARLHPAKVRGLALLASTPCFTQRPDWLHGMASGSLDDFARGLRADPLKTLDTFVHLNTFNVPGGRQAIRALTQGLETRPFASAEALDAGLEILRTADLRGGPGHARVLVIHGARDRIVPIEAGRWLAAATPGTTWVELEASAHLPFVTDRAAVLEAIERFDA